MRIISAVQEGFPVLSDADAALLFVAHQDLLKAQAGGVRLLGSTAGTELVTAARDQLTELFPDAEKAADALLEVAA